MKDKKLDFLRSNRFWSLVLGAVAAYLETKGVIGVEERNLIVTLTSAFIIVRTVDRASEKIGK